MGPSATMSKRRNKDINAKCGANEKTYKGALAGNINTDLMRPLS